MTEIRSSGLVGTAFTGPLWPSMGMPTPGTEALAGNWGWPLWEAVEVVPELAPPADQADDVALLVEITVYDKQAVQTFAGPMAPALAGPAGSWGFDIVGGTTTLYVGTKHVATDSDHTPADQPIAGAIVEALNFRAVTFDGIEPQGPSLFSKGSIRISDPGDRFAAWCHPRYAFDGWPVVFRRGRVRERRPVTDPATWPVVATLITAGLTWDSRGKVVGLRDLGGLLTRAPLLRTFGGTGGTDGDAAMVGRFKPRALGRGFYCAPPQINATLLIYKLNDGPIHRAPDVYDGGNRLGVAVYPDYATFAELAAASLSPGDVATCLATGDFRLGGRAQFTVVAYCNGGDATGGYVEKRAAIARRVVTSNGGYSLTTLQLDEGAFSRFDSAHHAPTGFYFDNEVTIGDALAEILGGVMGSWIVGTSGLLSIGWLEEPASTPDIIVDSKRILGAEISMTTPHIPRWRTIVEWRRNYSPLAAGQRAGNLEISEDEKRLWGSEGSYAEKSAPGLLTAHPFASSVLVRGGFALEVDARAEAVRANGLMSTPHRRFQVPAIQGDPFFDWQWKTVRFDGINRFSWGAELAVRCVGTGATGNGGTVAFEGWF